MPWTPCSTRQRPALDPPKTILTAPPPCRQESPRLRNVRRLRVCQWCRGRGKLRAQTRAAAVMAERTLAQGQGLAIDQPRDVQSHHRRCRESEGVVEPPLCSHVSALVYLIETLLTSDTLFSPLAMRATTAHACVVDILRNRPSRRVLNCRCHRRHQRALPLAFSLGIPSPHSILHLPRFVGR
jgi:hypothetical protein